MQVLTLNGKMLVTNSGKAIGLGLLLGKINQATGQNDETLGAAIDTLIAQGGGAQQVVGIEVESYDEATGCVKLKNV